MAPIQWVKDLIGRGDPRVHAVCVLWTFFVVGGCTITMTVYSFWVPRPAELAVLVGAMVSLTGYIYKKGKDSEGDTP
jgi:hypothetical protein